MRSKKGHELAGRVLGFTMRVFLTENHKMALISTNEIDVSVLHAIATGLCCLASHRCDAQVKRSQWDTFGPYIGNNYNASLYVDNFSFSMIFPYLRVCRSKKLHALLFVTIRFSKIPTVNM